MHPAFKWIIGIFIFLILFAPVVAAGLLGYVFDGLGNVIVFFKSINLPK